MKRFTSLDISAITRELREKVVGLRIANVYDLGKKTYQLKLAKPDHKQYLVFESGVRLHTTKFQRERQTVPSVFCLKLRRYLRTKRIEDVRQLGIDRVIDITIGSGEAQHHLIIELYASGNIILVDKNYAIETLIRSYKTGEGTDDEVSVAVGTRYPVDKARQLVPTTVDRLREVLHSVPEELRAKEAVKDVLNRHLDLGPALFEHCLLCADLKPHAKVSEYDDAKTEALHRAIQHAESLYSDPTLKGYIVLKDTKPDAAPAAPAKAPEGKGKGKETKQQPQQPQEEGRVEGEAQAPVVSATPAPQDAAKPDGEEDYDSRLFMLFVPYVYKQFEGRPRLEFPSFDEAVDIFFSKAQEQQVEVKKEQQEKTVIKKLDKARGLPACRTVKKDHETRIAALTKAEEECIKKAHLIETNVSDVDAAIKVTCSELARGMDWAQLTRVVKEAKKAGDPIANLIHSLDFANNRITLLLVDPLEAAADASGAMQKVEVDIGQTAYANAQEFYAEAKRRAHKHAKTVASSQMAVKAAEKKARREIKDVGVKAAIQKVRKAYWFEKFHWFISSENYVVISGRDAQQNELIVKRYLRKGDAYVHADLHGAATCVVKNPHPDKPIPALTLAEAGSMTVCRSSAWTAKARAIPTSAWWVHPEQVSKTAPSGEYLVTGSFMIRGKKNFLPPSQLVMGFAYMFKVDPTSVANHVNERAVRTLVELSELEGAGRGDAERSAAGGSDDEDQDSDDGDGKAVEGGAKAHAGKYRVQVLMDTPDDDDDVDAGSSSQPRPPQKEREKRARMSAAEKRRKKKLEKRGESAAAAPADEEPSPDHHHHQEEEEEDNDEGEEEAQQQQQQQQQQPKAKGPTQPKLLRGQKGKMKKMKKKYAEQDEEERDLRMRLLQSEGLKKKEEQRLKELELQKKRKGKGRGQAGRGGLPHQQHQQHQQQGAGRGEAARAGMGRGLPQKPPASPPGEGKEEGEGEAALAQPADEDVARVVAAGGGGGVATEAGDGGRDEEGEGVAGVESTGVVVVGEEEEEGLEAKRKRRQEKRHEKKKEAEEIRQIMEEENIKPLDESLLSEIDALTGVPVAEDALLFAVPVCAPYSVVQNYKYKIKLVPGSVKRGKAAKEAMSYFVSFPEATDRERDLLKAVEDSEIVLQLIGNVRIATSGLKQKAKGKGGKKGGGGGKKK